MANAPGQIEMTEEIPASTAGDQTPSAGAGKLIFFASGGLWYSKDGAGVVTLINSQVANGSVTNAKLADMAAATFKLRAAGSGTGPPIDGTPAQAKTALAIANTDVSGLGTLSTQSGTFSGTHSGASSGTNTGDQTATTVASNATGDVAATTVQGAITELASEKVPSSLILTATAPITGGGDLTTGRSFGISAATTGAAGSLSAADKSRLDNWFNKAVYNVLDHGISPANTGAQNVTAWDALMTTIAAAVDTATVVFPPSASFYDFASVCAIPAGLHLRVTGYGPGTRTSEAFGTIIRTTSATANIFSCGDWYQEFVSLHFRSSATRTAGAAILSGDNIAVNVYDCNFHEMWNGIVYQGGANAGNLSIIDNCGFTETKQFSIQIDGTNANTIIRGSVCDGTLGLADAHLEINACGSLLVSDSDFIRGANNVRFNPDSGTKGVFSVYFTNTFFDTSSGSSVIVMGGAAGCNVQRAKFTNCWFSGSVTGMEFAANSSTNKATAFDFTNCDIYSNSSFGVLATQVQDFSMSNCRIAGNTTAGIRLNATAGAVTKVLLQNNTIGPTAGIGANGIGVDVVAGTYGGYVITGNNVTGNTSNLNIVDNGSVGVTANKQISDNLGHILQGSLQLSTSGNAAVTTGRGAATSGVIQTFLFTCRVPANAVVVGSVFRIVVLLQSQGTGTFIPLLRAGAAGTIGGDIQLATTAVSAAGAVGSWLKVEGYVYVLALGPTATVGGHLQMFSLAATVGNATTAVETTANVPTTADWFITFSGLASASTYTVRSASVEAI